VYLCNGARTGGRTLLFWLALALISIPSLVMASSADKQWNDDALVAAYPELTLSGGLDEAVRNPQRPNEAPQAAFLDALAWYAAETPVHSGVLTLAQLDSFVDNQVALYRTYLKAKVEDGTNNDYTRTRTWKVIQKLALLRDEMLRPQSGGTYAYSAQPRATSADDPWEWSHTVSSEEDFRAKVCEGSKTKPVLVKYGNTNCTQCMLFELTGAIREFAESDSQRDAVDVYKVWWGMQPDDSFAGRIPVPTRLNELAKAEGVASSPSFIVYRDGRRYPCHGGYPTATGEDPELEVCLAKATGEAPVGTLCGKPS
jgi:hypothetical protein